MPLSKALGFGSWRASLSRRAFLKEWGKRRRPDRHKRVKGRRLRCLIAHLISGWVVEWMKREMQESGTEQAKMFEEA